MEIFKSTNILKIPLYRQTIEIGRYHAREADPEARFIGYATNESMCIRKNMECSHTRLDLGFAMNRSMYAFQLGKVTNVIQLEFYSSNCI